MTLRALTLLDSAMGTRLIASGLDIRCDDPALWVLSHPEKIHELHCADLNAGARVLTTCTFGANQIWLERFGSSEARTINRRAVEIARESIRGLGVNAQIAGCLGPTSLGSRSAFRQQIETLAESGVDRIVLETIASEQVPAVCELLPIPFGIPIYVTLWDWGDHVAEVASRLAGHGVAGWGVNCVSNSDVIFEVLTRLNQAELPASILKTSIKQVDSFVEVALQAIELGVDSIGGCCGTDPMHISALKNAVRHRNDTTGLAAKKNARGPVRCVDRTIKGLPGRVMPETPDHAGSDRNRIRPEP